jgi:hypothetical protein
MLFPDLQRIITRMKSKQSEFPRYPSINPAVLGVLILRLFRRRKSFLREAGRLIRRGRPPIRYLGLENIPARGPYQIHANHYARPGISTAWIALALSAVQPAEVTWIVADQWVFEGHPLRFLLIPAMRNILASMRWVYGFLPMPTMVPGYSEMSERSTSVRSVIRYCQSHPEAIIGLTPEGRDSPPSGVYLAPPGAGKFILHLNRMEIPILPAALLEKDGILTVIFGRPYDLPTKIDLPPSQVDEALRVIVRDKLLELYHSIA